MLRTLQCRQVRAPPHPTLSPGEARGEGSSGRCAMTFTSPMSEQLCSLSPERLHRSGERVGVNRSGERVGVRGCSSLRTLQCRQTRAPPHPTLSPGEAGGEGSSGPSAMTFTFPMPEQLCSLSPERLHRSGERVGVRGMLFASNTAMSRSQSAPSPNPLPRRGRGRGLERAVRDDLHFSDVRAAVLPLPRTAPSFGGEGWGEEDALRFEHCNVDKPERPLTQPSPPARPGERARAGRA